MGRFTRGVNAPHWHDDLDVKYVGPSLEEGLLSFKWELPPLDTTGSSGLTNAAPRIRDRIQAFRDAFRVLIRAAFEVDLLRRQKLFVIVNRKTGEQLDPLRAVIDFQSYYPILRPSLPELLSAYSLHLRLDADQVLRYDEEPGK